MPRSRTVLVPLLLVVLPLAACSGGGSGGTSSSAATAGGASPSPRPSPFARAEYVARAEALCESATFDLDRASGGEPEDVADGLNTLDLLVTRIDAATGDLGALTAPQPDAAEVDRIFLDPLRAQGATARAYRDAFRAAAEQGPQAVAAVPAPPDPTPAPDLAAMRAYGFDLCVDLADAS